MSIFVDIEKQLGSFHLKIAFEAGNEVLALLGASGCGKSMTLRCIAGIETPDRGRIIVDGVTLFDSERHVNLPPQRRKTGLLFQNYALFPNMTVWENLQAGCLEIKDKAQRKKQIQQVLEAFELTDCARQLPFQLSGGQQQRTALARILLSRPNILLLDEPFSALDAHLRFRLERTTMETIREFGKTVLLVSHDRDEVFRMSDQVVVMHQGAVEVQGTRDAVFKQPRTRQAAMLTGCKNIALCQPLSGEAVYVPQWGITLALPPQPVSPHYVGVRMHDILPGEGENTLLCDVVSEIENPFSYVVMLRCAASPQADPIGWELEKPLWQSLRGSQVTVHIPKDVLIPCVQENRGVFKI